MELHAILQDRFQRQQLNKFQMSPGHKTSLLQCKTHSKLPHHSSAVEILEILTKKVSCRPQKLELHSRTNTITPTTSISPLS